MFYLTLSDTARSFSIFGVFSIASILSFLKVLITMSINFASVIFYEEDKIKKHIVPVAHIFKKKNSKEHVTFNTLEDFESGKPYYVFYKTCDDTSCTQLNAHCRYRAIITNLGKTEDETFKQSKSLRRRIKFPNIAYLESSTTEDLEHTQQENKKKKTDRQLKVSFFFLL